MPGIAQGTEAVVDFFFFLDFKFNFNTTICISVCLQQRFLYDKSFAAIIAIGKSPCVCLQRAFKKKQKYSMRKKQMFVNINNSQK